ncbi:MAG: thiamine phosphate synthase, partial [Chromatiaceae bacterium]
MIRPLRGLYVITPDRAAPGPADAGPPLVDLVTSAIQGGARVVQYRDKGSGLSRRQTEASALLALCRG